MARSVAEIEADLVHVRAELKKLQAERRRSMKTDEALAWLPTWVHAAYKKKEGSDRVLFLKEARQLQECGLLDLVHYYWHDEWVFQTDPNYYLHVGFGSNGSVGGCSWKSKEGVGSGYPFDPCAANTLDEFLVLPSVGRAIDGARKYREKWGRF